MTGGFALRRVTLDIAELAPAYPHFSVALVVVCDLQVDVGRPPGVAELVATVAAEVAALLAATPSNALAEVQAWRAAYRSFGVKKTSYRCSVERLLRGIERGRGLPAVNSLVDCYNAVSVRHRMPVGADDLDRVKGGLAFRYSRPGDSFVALGDADAKEDPPKAGEVVYADEDKVLCRRWNWLQDARSAISPTTRSAVLTVQSLGPREQLPRAAQELSYWCSTHLGTQSGWAIADKSAPRIAIELPWGADDRVNSHCLTSM